LIQQLIVELELNMKGSIMNTLATLKLVQSKRPSELSPVVVRRTKLMKQLWQQIELVKAQQQGLTYQAVRYKTIRDLDTGLSRSVELPKRVKPWWWILDSGKICVAVRYGAKQLEIAKGKNAVEVASVDELIAVLEKIKLAVDQGELDQQIETASGALRAGFKK
jgi:hypothetical protein